MLVRADEHLDVNDDYKSAEHEVTINRQTSNLAVRFCCGVHSHKDCYGEQNALEHSV